MSHLSDYSYLERGENMFLLLLFMLMRIWTTGGFPKLNLLEAENRNLKSAVTILVIAASIAILIYDILLTGVKYEEGYFVKANGDIVHKPKSKWAPENVAVLPVTGALISIAFTCKSSAHFLTLAFWNNLASRECGASFGSSREFLAYRVYSVISFLMYPILQGIFSFNSLLTVVMPQMWYHVECLAVMALTLLANQRLKGMAESSASNATREKLNHYISMNNFIVFFNLLEFLGLGSINLDLFMGRNIYSSKFLTDAFTHLFSLGLPCCLCTVIVMLYPKLSVGLSSATSNTKYKSKLATSAPKDAGLTPTPTANAV